MLDPERHKVKTAANRKSSAEVLAARQVAFTSHSNGAHLVVEGLADFWPGTGLWMFRGRALRGRGVAKLIHEIRKMKEATQSTQAGKRN